MDGLATRRKETSKFVLKCLCGRHKRTNNATRHFMSWKGRQQLRNKASSFFPGIPVKSDGEKMRRLGTLRDAY